LLPSVAAAAAALISCAAFLMFEPTFDGEDIGIGVPVLAAFAIVLLGGAVWRGVGLVLSTRKTINAWLRTAQPITAHGISVPAFAVTTEFPVVSVIGLRHPRLLIARSVLSSCSEDELRAILAHEQGHIDRHDNLRRLLMAVAPDVLTWLPASSRLLDEWREASEDAADDDAANSGADGRLRLASALVKVARLAPAGQVSRMPASALYRGESLDRRVRRLVASRETGRETPQNTWRLRLGLLVVVAGSVSALETVHGVLEALIHHLP
jgi:hypothetical protein